MEWDCVVDSRTGRIISRRIESVEGGSCWVSLLSVVLLSAFWPILLMVAGEASRHGDSASSTVSLAGFLAGVVGLAYGFSSGVGLGMTAAYSVVFVAFSQLCILGLMGRSR